MKTYTMHVQNGDEHFHVSFSSDAPNYVRADTAFSACCSNMIWGFGDAKSSKLSKTVAEADRTGKASMAFKHHGTQVNIEVVAE